MANIRDLTPNETAALAAFANVNGKRWKSLLTDVYWYHARIWRDPDTGLENHGFTLHALRNDPRWSYEGLQAYQPQA